VHQLRYQKCFLDLSKLYRLYELSALQTTYMKPIIEIKNLGKKYDIQHMRGGYVALRDVLAHVFKNPFRFATHKVKDAIGLSKKEEFWALKDISLSIEKGEVIGIIGANGAGKSTLLKILTGITPPTEGEVIMRGRVSSLLEVGTGFHPELTGRENIFLNGAILGMTKSEIEKNFDAIVKFAGIEKFLDTPVKRYSSGMYVRLAFSVAAHMEPDILLVDEVLAVGDAEFQKKCLGKMEEVTQEQGRTILFVSHNMGAIRQLCQKTILLNKGEVVMFGNTQDVIDLYMNSHIGPRASKKWADRVSRDNIVSLRSVKIKQNQKVTDSIDIRHPIDIEAAYEVKEAGHVLYPNYHLYNDNNICVFVAGDYEKTWRGKVRPKGMYTTTATIPGNLLSEGRYTVWIAMSTLSPFTVHFEERDAVAFNIIDSFDGTSARGEYTGKIPGIIRPLLHWETQFKERVD